MNSDWPDHKDTRQKKPEHMYLQFSKPVTPFVEEIVDLHWFM